MTDFFEQGGLSGGGFGLVSVDRDAAGREVVVKAAKPSGGSFSNTVAVDIHRPDVGYWVPAGEVALHYTLPARDVAQVLRREAELLLHEGGHLLPGVYSRSERRSSPDATESVPVVVMERIRGRRATSVDDLIRVLQCLASASGAGRLGFHGDLKPEHIFIGAAWSVRVIDPAPRFPDGHVGAYTPEYNPHGLTGEFADVYSIAVMMYEVLAHVRPLIFQDRPFQIRREFQAPFFLQYADDNPRLGGPPPPVNRGRPYVDEAVAGFIDGVLQPWPEDVPAWAKLHASALGVLVDATWKHVRLRRAFSEQGWNVTLIDARDDAELSVQVGATTAWLTNAPESLSDETALRFFGSRDDVMRSIRALRRLPYVKNQEEGPSATVRTFWSGQTAGENLVLRTFSMSSVKHHVRMPLATLTEPAYSLAYRMGIDPLSDPWARVLLEPDWETTGLWMLFDNEPAGWIDAANLPISAELAARVVDWTGQLEALSELSDYPPEWKFQSEDEERCWIADGAVIAAELQRELGSNFQVSYRIWGVDQPFESDLNS